MRSGLACSIDVDGLQDICRAVSTACAKLFHDPRLSITMLAAHKMVGGDAAWRRQAPLCIQECTPPWCAGAPYLCLAFSPVTITNAAAGQCSPVQKRTSNGAQHLCGMHAAPLCPHSTPVHAE